MELQPPVYTMESTSLYNGRVGILPEVAGCLWAK